MRKFSVRDRILVMFAILLVGGGFLLIEYLCEIFLRTRRRADVKYSNY